MKTVDKEWIDHHRQEFFAEIQHGNLIIYPTDTIYGIGCDARNADSIQRLRDLKQRPEKPFSVIAPSKKWIQDHFIIPQDALDMLPGPVTLFLQPKTGGLLPEGINPSGTSIGVRIPDHWFSTIISESGTPFITTSVNISDHSHMTALDDIPLSFHDTVSLCIYEGPIHGTSSTKFDFTSV